MLCNAQLLAKSNHADDFAAKIRQALAKSSRTTCSSSVTASYQDLLDTITLEAGA
jgi:hypothetical protein